MESAKYHSEMLRRAQSLRKLQDDYREERDPSKKRDLAEEISEERAELIAFIENNKPE